MWPLNFQIPLEEQGAPTGVVGWDKERRGGLLVEENLVGSKGCWQVVGGYLLGVRGTGVSSSESGVFVGIVGQDVEMKA